MSVSLDRRDFLKGTLAAVAVGESASALPAAPGDLPTNDPAAAYKLSWTQKLPWKRVVDVRSIRGRTWDDRVARAQAKLGAAGGVLYFPRGVYRFAKSIKLKDGVILRGADPTAAKDAKSAKYVLPAKFEFPQFKPVLKADGTPIDSAFKGISLAFPQRGGGCGVVNIDINCGHIDFGESKDHKCGSNRLVVGCILRNAAVADPSVPIARYKQHAWQRFTHRHHAAIDVKAAANILVANNRLPKSGEANFAMNGYVVRPRRRSKGVFDGVVFDYDNRPGLYINHHCIGGAGGSGNDGTPKSHPWGFRKGIVIRDNFIFNTGRMAIGFCGDGVLCTGNVIRFAKDVWRPTATGQAMTTGSSTNDNRAIEMRGWRWVVQDNDYLVYRNWAAGKKYLINDGEGLMHEDHCNSDLRDSQLIGNTGNAYLSLYKCGPIDGLRVEGNAISVKRGPAIHVASNRNIGAQPCRNVTIAGNKTIGGGILIAGSPASGNSVTDNVHKGPGGAIQNRAKAKISGNTGYRVIG